jgi:hypothetical protein
MTIFPRFGSNRRHRSGVIAAAVLGVLVAAGGAWAFHGFSSASQVSATFSAGTVANSQSQTCTAANGDSIQVTEATFTGTASSSDPHLNGPIMIDATSVFDATTTVGTVTGDVSINSGGAGFEGRLLAVNVKGALQGLLVGRENGGGSLVGNVTSTFTTTAGFGSSTIGSGTGTNTAIVATGECTSRSGDEDQDEDTGNGNGEGNFAGPGNLPSIGTAGFGGHDHHGGGQGNQD